MDRDIERKRRKRKAGKIKLFSLAAVFLIVAVCGVMAVVIHYTPTKEKKSLYEYFNVEESDSSIMIFLNNEKEEAKAIKKDGDIYVPQEFVENVINKRFYLDGESGNVLYVDDKHIYTYKSDELKYMDEAGNSYALEKAFMINDDGKNYLNIDQVKAVTDMDYKFFDAPGRLVIVMGSEPTKYVETTRKTYIRYRGGIKSPVLEEVPNQSQLIYKKNVDEWVEVQTESGIVGYVQAKCVTDIKEKTRETSYVTNFEHINRDKKISLVWYQVGGTMGNQSIDGMIANTKGINVISPTWYQISDNDGNMSDFSSKEFVDKMHRLGIEVWPLVNDFSKELDTKSLFGSKKSRDNMINRLISDAKSKGYDGINLDFENVSKEGAKDFLQFVRELSVDCKKNGIVLSIDNYKPESYNRHYDISEQGAYADYIILMGYDEHYAGSKSGSVASIGFVEDGIVKALKSVPKEQLINAMPFYTRVWTEKDGETTSTAVGMQSAINQLSNNGVAAIWNETAGQYFGQYEKNGATIKIWVEEDRSIGEKLKLYQKYDLAGVGAWKLGLEKASVWNVISEYVK